MPVHINTHVVMLCTVISFILLFARTFHSCCGVLAYSDLMKNNNQNNIYSSLIVHVHTFT